MKKHSFLCAVMAIALLFVLFSCEGELGQAVCKVTLVFDNDGLNETIETVVPAGFTFKIPDAVPLKDGCIFDHWEDSNGNVYEPEQTVTINSDMVITAKWKTGADLPDNQVIVTYVLNDTLFAAQIVDKGTVITDPTDGYEIPQDNVFSGWYIEDESALFDLSTPITEAIKLKAWIGKRVYVSIDARNEEMSSHYEIVSGMKVKEPAQPDRDGCQFMYWYVSGNEDTPYDFNTPVKGNELGSFFLCAKYDRDYSTVTFDPDNGEDPISQPQILWNTTADVVLDPLKEGKVFLGWFEDGAETSFNFDTKITKDTTLKAKWGDSTSERESDKVIVTYDMNDDSLTDRTITLNKGNSLYILGTIQNPEDFASKFFDYWVNGAGERITWDNEYIKVDTDKTFTAVWRSDIVVHFVPNNEEEESVTTVAIGSSITKPADNPTRENSTFLGWYEEMSGNEYDFSASVTAYYSDIYLYAKYSPEYYLVTFDPANGGEKWTKEVSWGDGINAGSDPKYEGHVFVGWFIDDETEFDFRNTRVKQDYTLIAHWNEGEEVPAEKCVITFNFDDPDLDNESFTVDKGSFQYLNSMVDTYQKHPEGKTFVAWQYEDGTRVPSTGGCSVTDSIELKAIWTTREVSVNFQTYCDTKIDNQTVKWGETVTKPGVVLTREGSEFLGWYYYDNSGERSEYDFNTPVTSEWLTVYALWNPEYFTVTFDPANEEEKWEETHVYWGMTVSAPTDPVCSGKYFAGWYIDEETEYNFSSPVEKNITLTAHWSEEKPGDKCVITYVFGDGLSNDTLTVDKGTEIYVGDSIDTYKKHPEGKELDYWTYEGGYRVSKSITVNEDMTFTAVWKTQTVYLYLYSDNALYSKQETTWGTVIDEPKPPTKDGYVFGGWADYLGTESYVFSNGIRTTGGANVLTLYAIWTPETYTVTVNTNRGKDESTDYTVAYGTILNLATPEYGSYRFLGWYDGETKFEARTEAVKKSMTLTARWSDEEVSLFNVVFLYPDEYLNESSDEEAQSYTTEVESGNSVEAPSDVTIEGLVFKGWYKGDSTFDPAIFLGSPYDFENTVTGDTYLYAKYILLEEKLKGSWTIPVAQMEILDENGVKKINVLVGKAEGLVEVGTWDYNEETGKLGAEFTGSYAYYLTGMMPQFLGNSLGETEETLVTVTFSNSPSYTYSSTRKTRAKDNVKGIWTRQGDTLWTCTVNFEEEKATESFSLFSNAEKKGDAVATTVFETKYEFISSDEMAGALLIDSSTYKGYEDAKATFSTSVTYAKDADTFYAVGFMGNTATPFTRTTSE